MISQRRTFYSAILFAALLLCWTPAIAQPATAETAKLGTISGRVVNESGRPLPNAHIFLRRAGSINIEDTNTTTDREGKFELSGLAPVSYQMSASLRGYTPLPRDFNDDQASLYHIGDSVTLVLTKGGVITGTVTDQEGEPVVGILVRALMVHGAAPFPYNLIGAANLTDDRGVYRIYGLPEGNYVAWAGGTGPPSMNVDPFDSDVPTYAPSSTRDTAQEITVREGVETNNVDIHYRGDSGHVISGRAIGPADNQPGRFVIALVSASGPEWESRAFQDAGDRGFKLEGLDDGDYYLIAISPRPNGEWLLSPTRQIKVRGADVSGIELLVQPMGSVAGRVSLEELKAPECTNKQRPVFTETLVSAQGNEVAVLKGMLKFLLPTASADERGNFLLKALQSGRYYFTTQYFGKDWYLKSLSFAPPETAKAAKPLDAARTWTTLKPGERMNGLTITLAQGAASLHGQVALGKGETRPERLYVYLIPTGKEAADDPLRFYVAPVTAEGKFGLNQIAPGRYLVLAQTVSDESVSPLISLRSPDGTTYRSKLRRDAESLKTEIELKPCQKAADLKAPLRATPTQ